MDQVWSRYHGAVRDWMHFNAFHLFTVVPFFFFNVYLTSIVIRQKSSENLQCISCFPCLRCISCFVRMLPRLIFCFSLIKARKLEDELDRLSGLINSLNLAGSAQWLWSFECKKPKSLCQLTDSAVINKNWSTPQARVKSKVWKSLLQVSSTAYPLISV